MPKAAPTGAPVNCRVVWRREGSMLNAYYAPLVGPGEWVHVLSANAQVLNHPGDRATLWADLKTALDQWLLRRVKEVAPEADARLVRLPHTGDQVPS